MAIFVSNQTNSSRRFSVHTINTEGDKKLIFTNLLPRLINDPEKFHQYVRVSYKQLINVQHLIRDLLCCLSRVTRFSKSFETRGMKLSRKPSCCVL